MVTALHIIPIENIKRGMTFVTKCEYEKVRLEYARAYIVPQKYENLFSISEGFCKGTLFEDLYKLYKKNSLMNPFLYMLCNFWI